MSSEFIKYELGDLVDLVIDYRGKTPKKLGGEWSETGIKALSAKNIKTGKIIREDTIRYVDLELYKKWMKEEICRNDILITSEAPFGEIFFWDSDEKIVLSQRLFAVRCDEKKVNPKFIYFYMTSEEFQWELQSRATGTTVKGLRQPELLKCNILVPSYENQLKISEILSNLEDKINVLKKINQNLEKLVLHIFKKLFINYDGIENNMKGWKKGEIGDYCKVKSGFAFKSSWWQEDGVKVIKIKDIQPGHIDLSNCSYVSEDRINEKADNFLVVGGDIVIAMTGATLGKFSIVPKHDGSLYVNQRVGKFFLGNEPLKKLPFLWCLLNQKRIFNEIINRGQGSAQPNISSKDIETIPILLPPNEVINKFNGECYDIFNLIINNFYEIEKLTELRDFLLPLLMSGQVVVED